MKIAHFLSAGLTVLLLSVQALAATDVAASWTVELNLAQQAYNQGNDGRARADAVMRGIAAEITSGRSAGLPPAGANLDAASAQATYSALSVLYPGRLSALDATLAESLAAIDDSVSAIAAGREWGRHVAGIVLAENPEAVSVNASSFSRADQPPADPTVSRSTATEAIIGPGRYRVSVLAGELDAKGYVDSVGAAARFDQPGGIAVDAAGNVFVSEKDLNVIRKISPSGAVSTLAGLAGQKGGQDGAGAVARFNYPQGLAVDGAGNVLVADTGNHTIRKIDPAGNVTTVAGRAGDIGSVDGTREKAKFNSPTLVTVDDSGRIFCTEMPTTATAALPVRMVAPDGMVSKLPNPPEAASGWAMQLCADHQGSLYVLYSDGWDYSDVWKFSRMAEGQYSVSRRKSPTTLSWAWSMAVDGGDNLYVNYDVQLTKFTPDGVAEIRYVGGEAGGYLWNSFAADRLGRLVVLGDNAWGGKFGTVEVGMFDPVATGPVIIRQPDDRTPFRGAEARFIVYAGGATAFTYQWYFNSTAIAGATSETLVVNNAQAAAEGIYSVILSDRTGSVTSRKAKLTLSEPPPPAPPAPAAPAPAPKVSTGISGGGSFDRESALAALLLLAAAMMRRSGRPRVFLDSGEF